MTRVGVGVLTLVLMLPAVAFGQSTGRISLRGKPQTVQLYGRPDGDPAIVSSGDGGWIHLGPRVAELLAAHGFFVVGFDSKAYLEAFTAGTNTLTTKEVPADYRELVKYAARNSTKKPLLIGVSEGAALSLLAATEPETKAMVTGVIGLGLGDLNELGWRWKDAVIYVTHGVPNEPTFCAIAIAPAVTPTPFAMINSTHDEFVTLEDAHRIIGAALPPKKLWTIESSDHRFSNNPAALSERLFEAIDWIRQNQPR